MIPLSRKLESIVPKQYKKTFSLYHEDDTQFSLSSSPKKAEGGMSAQDSAPAAEATNDAPGVEQSIEPAKGDKDKSSWLIKKLVGTLRYAGAMSTEMRGAVPDEAMEIIEKLESELEELAKSLDPFVTESHGDTEEEQSPEEPQQNAEQPEEQNTEPQQDNTTKEV
jgi:hypothetical protein